MKHAFCNHRAFIIPAKKLDLFLVKLNMSRHEFGYYKAEYIFREGDSYVVVVYAYGDHKSAYHDNQIEKFAGEL